MNSDESDPETGPSAGDRKPLRDIGLRGIVKVVLGFGFTFMITVILFSALIPPAEHKETVVTALGLAAGLLVVLNLGPRSTS